MKKSFRILLTLVLVLVTLLSLTACISDCDAGMHAFVEIPAKEATCTEAGNVAYKRCRVCELCLDENGKQISPANTIIPAKGHDLDEHPASAPTCTADGTVQYWECKTCGAKFSDKDATAEITVIVDGATGHVKTTHKDEIPATCVKEGTKAHDVCDCGALLFEGKVVEAKDLVIEIDANAHKFGTWVDEVPATCVKEGTLGHYHCSACEHNFDSNKNELSSLTIAIDKTNGHSWTDVPQKPATCTEDGYTAHQECTLCHTTTGKTVLPKGHDIQHHDAKTATCTETGWGAYETCSRCDYTTKVEIPATGHVKTTHKDEIPATCTMTGTKAHDVCDDCGALLIDGKVVEAKDLVIKIDANAHKPATSWTATDDGLRHYHKCQNEGCDVKLDLADHNVEGASWKNDDTKHWKECVDCGAKVGETDHVAQGEWQSNDTNHWQLCECGAKVGETAHTPVMDKAVDPDCTNVGKTEGSHCEICSKVIVEQTEVPATGHTYGDLVAKQPETCTTNGVDEHYRCTVCDGYFQNDEAKTPTTLEDLEIPASHILVYEDTSSTHHTVTCGREGCTYTAQVEHSYSETEHKCVCGKTVPTATLVTDVSKLNAGDKIIIVGVKTSKNNPDEYYALSTDQKTDNRGIVSITKNDDTILINDQVQIIVVEDGIMESTFALRVGDEYLYCASTDSRNYLKSKELKDKSASWTIVISNNSAKITSQIENITRNLLQYNSGNKCFACYASSSKMQDVSIYKLEECTHPEEFATTTHVDATCTEPGKNVTKCSYCGTKTTTEIANEPALGHNLSYTTTDTHHSATCSRCDYVVESTLHSYGDTHKCVCGKTEPTYTITITNLANGENSATVVVEVGDDTINPENGVYTIYQGREVTITVTAPSGYILSCVNKDDVAITNFVDSHTFTINSDTTFEIEIQVIDTAHNHEYTVAMKLAESHAQYETHHQMKCNNCNEVSDTLEAHYWTTVKIVEGNSTQHKLVCACGHEKLEDHDFGDATPCTDDTTKHQQTCADCSYVLTTEHSYDNTTHACVCGKTDPNVVTSIAGALTATNDTLVLISGIVVRIETAWNTQYNNMSVWISDGTNEVLAYRTKTQVAVKDIVTVNGKMSVSSSKRQIAAGSTMEITGTHTCSYDAATCTAPAICPTCGETSGNALGHIDENGDKVCDRDGCDYVFPEVGAQITVTVKIADYASKNSWSNGTQYSKIQLDDITVTATGGSNTGKYYSSGSNWRIYQNETPYVVISAVTGYEIVSVKITYTVGKTGVLTLDGSNIESDKIVEVNASSITFSVGNTGTATNGQVRITAIEVVYKAV